MLHSGHTFLSVPALFSSIWNNSQCTKPSARMRSEGYSTRSLCPSVCPRLFSHCRQRSGIRAIPTAPAQQVIENLKGDFAKTKAFDIEKLALSRTALRDPAHQLAVWYIRVGVRVRTRGYFGVYMRIEPRGDFCKTVTSVTSTSFFCLLREFSAL